MAVNWEFYEDPNFEVINGKYLPLTGEGETKATQIVTATNKLIYRWYNDGDVFDNTYYLNGWANDLSSYANWLYENTTEKIKNILDGIITCYSESDYEDLLQALANEVFDIDYLNEQNKLEKINTIYEYDGKFKFVEAYEEGEYY